VRGGSTVDSVVYTEIPSISFPTQWRDPRGFQSTAKTCRGDCNVSSRRSSLQWWRARRGRRRTLRSIRTRVSPSIRPSDIVGELTVWQCARVAVGAGGVRPPGEPRERSASSGVTDRYRDLGNCRYWSRWESRFKQMNHSRSHLLTESRDMLRSFISTSPIGLQSNHDPTRSCSRCQWTVRYPGQRASPRAGAIERAPPRL